MTGTYAVEVRITPRPGILDPEGQTIARALGNLGYEGISEVRAGRLVRLRVRAGDADAARESVERMCEQLIANPVIEDYEVRVREEGGPDGGGHAERGADGGGSAGRGADGSGGDGGRVGTPGAAAGGAA